MNSTRVQRVGWYMADWANSAFTTTVVTVFMGPYLTSVAEHAVVDGGVPFLGLHLHPGSVFAYAVSISVLLQVFVLPLIGVVTDRSRNKRSLLLATSVVGSIATSLLFFLNVDLGNWLYGALLFIVANIAFGANVVVVNAFLPVLASKESRDKVSSIGWAIGYLGGGLLLLVQLLWFEQADATGGSTSLAVRGILSSAGIWWGLFSLAPWMALPRDVPSQAPSQNRPFTQFLHTLKEMRAYPMTMLFFVAYLFYNDAIQTVIQMASVFGQEELHLPLGTLTKAILLVQFVAIGGSLLFGRLARAMGTKPAIVFGLCGWAGVLVAAYTVVDGETGFYVLAAVIAVVLGGTQALSRSLFSMMIPQEKAAEYFALYEISDKGTSWLGPLVFGLALNFTGSYRAAVLSLIIFIAVGLLLLLRVNVTSAMQRSGNL
ncbi:MAG: MFS transporter [Bradyrhizobiaceae bacterium]|nr:MFS transporter [Bradyrhizobiaceae bacterium]